MSVYSGHVAHNSDPKLPFAAEVLNEEGVVIERFPAATHAGAEAKIIEVLNGLQDEAAEHRARG